MKASISLNVAENSIKFFVVYLIFFTINAACKMPVLDCFSSLHLCRFRLSCARFRDIDLCLAGSHRAILEGCLSSKSSAYIRNVLGFA